MDRHQKTWILFGFIGVALSGWTLVRAAYRTQSAIKKQQALQNTFKTNKDQNINFEQIKSQNKPQTVIFCGVRATLNPTSFTYIQRDVSNHNYLIQDRPHLKNMAGGTFQFKFNDQTFLCDIRDATIFRSVLNQTKKPISIFRNSSLEPLVSDVTYNLKPFATMVLYGTLAFDVQTQKFQLYPKFIGSTYLEFQTYLSQKYSIRLLQAIAAGLCVVGLSYFLIYKPIKNLLRRDQQKLKGAKKSQLSFFQKLNFFSSKNENKLKCIICKSNDSDMVFQCGHIQICQKCKEKQKVPTCTICCKKSLKFMKIFVS